MPGPETIKGTGVVFAFADTPDKTKEMPVLKLAGDRREVCGPYCRREYSDQQARADRASVHPWHRPEEGVGDHGEGEDSGRAPGLAIERPGSAADSRSDRPRLYGRGRPASRSRHQRQAPDGPRLLSRPAPSPWAAGARSAHSHQRAHPEGSGQVDRRQEEVISRIANSA